MKLGSGKTLIKPEKFLTTFGNVIDGSDERMRLCIKGNVWSSTVLDDASIKNH